MYTLYLNGGKSWIEPALRVFVLHEPVPFALGQHGVHQVHLPEGVDVHFAYALSVLQPVILFVTIVVFSGAQCVRNTLYAVHNLHTQAHTWPSLQVDHSLTL